MQTFSTTKDETKDAMQDYASSKNPHLGSDVRFSDVAKRIDPTTVSFSSVTDPGGTRVLEQNYEFDLVSQEKLLERYLLHWTPISRPRFSNTETCSTPGRTDSSPVRSAHASMTVPIRSTLSSAKLVS